MNKSLVKFIATSLARSKTALVSAGTAAASLAESLLLVLKCRFAEDIGKIKICGLDRLEAEGKRRLAEAADTSNKVTSEAHVREMERQEQQSKALDNRLKAAQVRIAESNANTAEAESEAKRAAYKSMTELFEEMRNTEITKKQDALFEAIRKLEAQGGKIYLNEAQLKQLKDASQEKVGSSPS